MWPWEHAAIGYLAYSGLCRYRGYVPSGGAAIALLVGTQLPDLVDKPLAWWLGVLPTGRSLGHSLLLAIPVCLAVWLVCRRLGRSEIGVAFAVGYLLHPPVDAISPLLYGNSPHLDFLVWPLLPLPESSAPAFSAEALVAFVTSPLGLLYLGFELLLLGGTLVLWRRDGYPGLEWLGITRDPAGKYAPEPDETTDCISDVGE